MTHILRNPESVLRLEYFDVAEVLGRECPGRLEKITVFPIPI